MDSLTPSSLKPLLGKIYKDCGFDFRQYKESTLQRRIAKRLNSLGQVHSYQDYICYLDQDPTEYQRLLRDLTIKVTEFFRDREAFELMKTKVLPRLVEEKIRNSSNAQLKIWSAGCASGEEVYSMAVLLEEILEGKRDRVEVEIYGTDIDREFLIKADQAKYKSDAIRSIPHEFLEKYFSQNGCVSVKELSKRHCQFLFHNLVQDPPFYGMDLIVCRNVLIYFERSLQEKICTQFYEALQEGGFLFLGKAETLLGSAQERFRVIDKRWRIYQKNGIWPHLKEGV